MRLQAQFFFESECPVSRLDISLELNLTFFRFPRSSKSEADLACFQVLNPKLRTVFFRYGNVNSHYLDLFAYGFRERVFDQENLSIKRTWIRRIRRKRKLHLSRDEGSMNEI
ncbi:hypothetical protein CEXT_807911 [Caerostris extrusa]|uniref:Uncharacterized protein n=1 Tax=Caerostris extrusa TaxID=172846 RepID=A0AAV4YBF9_CAEEX|nr:hypothetical protein CEXT_807911 [Caerostris extrusa]